MPTSVVALAILALVGVPGYVYKRLRPGPEEGTSNNESNLSEVLQLVFFGLTCAFGGVLVTLYALPGVWSGVVADVDEGASLSREDMFNLGFLALVAFVGSLLSALLFAGVVRLAGTRDRNVRLEAWDRKHPVKAGLVLAGTALALVAAIVTFGRVWIE
ncbi:DUF6338 family protein [Geodermatophilus sp. URMC 64]